MIFFVVFLVSHLCCKLDFTFDQKVFNLALRVNFLDRHIGRRCEKVARALAILEAVSSSTPPVFDTILARYANFCIRCIDPVANVSGRGYFSGAHFLGLLRVDLKTHFGSLQLLLIDRRSLGHLVGHNNFGRFLIEKLCNDN